MTHRRAGLLAMHLPAGAQTWSSCGYDAAWTETEHIAALQFDAAQIANWQRSGGNDSNRPTPLRRPSDVKAQTSTHDRIAERAAAYEARQSTPPPRARDARGRFVKEA